jgi:hypothetical protein
MDTITERTGMREMFFTSRTREVRQVSSQIEMLMQRARVMGQDVQANTALQDVIAKRDKVERDLSALGQADSGQLTELRGRIDLQIDDLERLSRSTIRDILAQGNAQPARPIRVS